MSIRMYRTTTNRRTAERTTVWVLALEHSQDKRVSVLLEAGRHE